MRYLGRGRFLLVFIVGVLLAAWTQTAWAQGRGQRGTAQAPTGIPMPDTAPAETHQKITINGETLAYTARAGFLPLRNATTGLTSAHLFFTYYAKDGVADQATRPLVVFLGGGPGVASTWQEFGGLGPKRMKWSHDGTAGAPPYGWADNPQTLLDEADLVFVNPVGTAFSRADQPGGAPEFWTTAGDVSSLAEFVRSFGTVYGRLNSPLFLAGDDVGTGRAAGLAAYLLDHQVPVSGVVLLSMAPSPDALAGDTQYLTLLPSMTLAAWHYKKLGPELQALGIDRVAEQARQFASREYLQALYKGDRMTLDERARVAASLVRLTGLSTAFLVNNDLRIVLDRFTPELFSAERRALSVSDARVAGFVPLPAGGGRGGFRGGAPVGAVDYNQANLAGGFLTAYETYLQRELAFTGPPDVFYLSGGGVATFTSTGNDEASLSSAFARDPRLRLFVGVNYFDLTAPFYAVEFAVAHVSASPEVRARNITVRHYEAGHMTYVDNEALARLHADLVAFLKGTPAAARQ